MDYSSIEVRVCAYLAGEESMLAIFKEGRDVYCETGAKLFGRPVSKETPRDRFIAKQIVLGCQYGLGEARLRHTLAKEGIILSPDEGQEFVDKYRMAYTRIRNFWYSLERLLQRGFVVLPSGRRITYPKLRTNKAGDREFWSGRFWEKIYGAKVCENVTQAVSRDIMCYHWLQLDALGLEVVMTVHDELVALVKTEEAEKARDLMCGVMVRPPPFLPEIPLDVEAIISPVYRK